MPEHNFNQADDALLRLRMMGFSVVNPMYSMSSRHAKIISHELWMENDFPIIERCDILLRLPGTSVGADAEVAFALENNIPVYDDIEELINNHWERPAA